MNYKNSSEKILFYFFLLKRYLHSMYFFLDCFLAYWLYLVLFVQTHTGEKTLCKVARIAQIWSKNNYVQMPKNPPFWIIPSLIYHQFDMKVVQFHYNTCTFSKLQKSSHNGGGTPRIRTVLLAKFQQLSSSFPSDLGWKNFGFVFCLVFRYKLERKKTFF